MGTENDEKHTANGSRISPDALKEIENALRDYGRDVRRAGLAEDGLKETTVKTYTDGAEKFVDWLKYKFTPGPPANGLTRISPWAKTMNIERPAAKKSRISSSALGEAEGALEEYIREVLQARRGERSTNQLGDPADYFVRWLKYEFAPGVRKSGRGVKGDGALRQRASN